MKKCLTKVMLKRLTKGITVLFLVSLAGCSNNQKDLDNPSSIPIQTKQGAAQAFCDLDMNQPHNFIAPTTFFKNGSTIDCQSKSLTYGIRNVNDESDPGHMIINIDPPKDTKVSSLDCDAKADIGSKIVAINCIPVADESPDHEQPS